MNRGGVVTEPSGGGLVGTHGKPMNCCFAQKGMQLQWF